MSAQPLRERERELEALETAVDRLTDGVGAFVLVEGPAGIGKTRLLEETVERSRRRDVLVRPARGGEVERDMPFGVARQLFEPVVERASDEERSRLLAGSAGLALVALGRTAAGHSRSEGDPFAAIHGLYWLLANLADAGPVLIAVDDVHWSDAQTLRFFDYLSRRVAELPVLVVAGARSGEPDEPAGLERLRQEAELIRPAPLSPRAVRELIVADLGGEPSSALCAACVRATAGNPFLLSELLRELQAEAIEPARAAATVADLGPERVARSVLLRLSRFGADAISLARAIAVLGGSPQLRHAAGISGVEDERAGELCDHLREAGILAAGRPIQFLHPLVRSAIYRELSEEARSASHRRAAVVLASTGTGARDLAPHLMACAPNGDQWVVAQLRAAAREAVAAGAHDSAASYLKRAVEEPPDDDLPVLYELGRALFEADPARSPDILADVAERAADPELRVAALRLVAMGHFRAGDVVEAARKTAEALEAVPPDDREETLLLEAHLFSFTVMRGRDPSASERIAAVATGAQGKTPGECLVRQALGYDRFWSCGPVDHVVELVGSPSPPRWEVRGVRVLPPSFACKILASCGQWQRARSEAALFTEAARASGLLVGVSTGHGLLAESDRLGGGLVDAEIEARTAWEIANAFAPFSPFGWMAIMSLLATLIARGEIEAAAALADRIPLVAGPRELAASPWPVELRGYLRLAQGDLAQATEDLLALGEAAESLGYLNPAGSPWRQEVAPALALRDRTAEAEQIIAVAEERAREFGAPHVLGTVLRSRGLVEGRARGIETLRESVGLLERAGPPHELARSLLELGSALRRNGQRAEARKILRRALEVAHRCGAGGLEQRTREELAAVGSRPRSAFGTGVASLTASELRIAKLAAEGLNNREIAERLFITRSTVETHLSHAYRKLGIGGRAELSTAFAELDAQRPQT